MMPIRRLVVPVLLCLAAVAPLTLARAADEQGFVAAYRKAFEAKDAKTLNGFLYTKGADPMVLDFYKAMQAQGFGETLASIELVTLTPEQVADAMKPKDGPSGKLALTLTPSKKLVLKTATNSESGSSTSTSSIFVAEADGKLVVPVPGPVK